MTLALIASALVVTTVPSIAGATLVFTRNPFHTTVFQANDDGSHAQKIGPGSSPAVSPDGKSIVYGKAGKASELLTLVRSEGGRARTLMSGWQDPFHLAFSPDSKLVAALRGHELGRLKLVVIDVASGKQKVVASGFFSGFSFSPDSREIVFSRTKSSFSLNGDIFRVGVNRGKPRPVTRDHRSTDPLWGPDGRIVFDKVRDLKSEFGPKGDLYLTDTEGRHAKRLTHTKIAPLLFGVSPVDWSGDGSRLLGEFGGQDTSYAVTVNPRTGAERKVVPGDMEIGFDGDALSKDGKLVLGVSGGAEPNPNQEIAVVPYGGGKKKVLTKGYEPDWSR
jgi:Tol biopolymer transport system component